MHKTANSGVKYYDLNENIADVYFALDSGLHITNWKKISKKLLKNNVNNIVGKSIHDVINSTKSDLTAQLCKEVLRTKIPRSLITKDFQFNGNNFSLINVYPAAEGLTILAKDISSIKLTDESRLKENRFRSTLDNMVEGCAILDFEWNYLYVNEVNARHSHKSIAEMENHTIFEVAPGIEKTPFFEAFKRTMLERIPQQIESDFTFPDGSVFWYEARSVPIPEGIFVQSIDISQRKQDEQTLLRYQSILSQSERIAKIGSWWIDIIDTENINSNPVHWSDGVYNILGYEPQSIIASNDLFFQHVRPNDREFLSRELELSIKNYIPLQAEYTIVRTDGNERILLGQAEWHKDHHGKPARLVGAIKDITEIRKSEQDRERLLWEIENERDKLKTVIESIPDEIWVINGKQQVQFINTAAAKRLGLSNSDDLNIQTVFSKTDAYNLDGTPRKLNENGILQSFNGDIISYDIMIRDSIQNEWGYRHFNSVPIKDRNGKIFGALAILTDISDRKRTEQKIRDLLSISERRTAELNAILDSIPDALFIGNILGITKCNDKALNLLGADSLDDLQKGIEYLGNKFNIRWPDSGLPLKNDELPFNRALQGEIVVEEVLATNGTTNQDVYIRIACAPVILNGKVIAAVAVESDITEKNRTEKIIKTSLLEKEVLLQEIFHRTKNNMQVISSILGLKAEAVKDNKEMTEILEEMKNRIQTISLVHQMLFASNNLSRVDLAEYIRNLVNLLMTSSFHHPGKVNFELDLDTIYVLIDLAVPCGLMINELLSNSLKYAFPGDRNGKIIIKLTSKDDQFIELKISDNGIGMKKSDYTGNDNLGLKLFYMLADQLSAKTKLELKNGVSWDIVFSADSYSERI